MKQTLSAILMMVSFICFGQTTASRLSIQSEDGKPSFLYINNALQNEQPSNIVTVNNVADNAAIRVTFKGLKSSSLQQRIHCDADNEFFIIKKSKGKYKLFEAAIDPDISLSVSPNGFDMNIKQGNAIINNTSVSQTSIDNNGSSVVTSTTTYSSTVNNNRPHNYNCNKPTLSSKGFKEFEAAVKESNFDHSRISYIYKNIDKYCWQADQVAILVKLIYNDEEQIKLAQYAYSQIYNIEDYEIVIDALSSARKRIILREWWQNLGKPNPTSDYPRPVPTTDKSTCRGNYINDSDFADVLRSIQKIAFEDTKLTQLDAATKNTCLSIDQVRKLVRLFTFEDNRLAAAKKLYHSTHEKQKFYQVTDDFTFDENKSELAEFINGQLK